MGTIRIGSAGHRFSDESLFHIRRAGFTVTQPLSAGRDILNGVDSDAISVRLVEWNVAMSLHRKAHLLAELNPTVAIFPSRLTPIRPGRP